MHSTIVPTARFTRQFVARPAAVPACLPATVPTTGTGCPPERKPFPVHPAHVHPHGGGTPADLSTLGGDKFAGDATDAPGTAAGYAGLSR